MSNLPPARPPAAPASVVEGTSFKPPMMRRQYSDRSEVAFGKLSECEQKLVDFETRFRDHVYAVTGTQDLNLLISMKNDLAQMGGQVDVLQMKEIDGVSTAELSSGKEEARSNRKYLNKRAGTLAERIVELHNAIQEYIEQNS